MICYKDKTWCPYGSACIDSKKCDRNFTKEEEVKAVEWWGDEHFPISFYSKQPKCFNDGKTCDNNNKE